MSAVKPARLGVARSPQPVVRSRSEQVGVLAVAALGPLVIGYAAVAALLALVTSVAVDAVFSTTGVLAAAGPAWLAAYHVPVEISGHELGALPLLPTILVMALVARAAGGAADRLSTPSRSAALPVVGAVGGAHAVFGALVALVCSRESLASSPVLAFFACGVFATVAAIAGVTGPAALIRAVLNRADQALVVGLRAAALCLVALLGASAIVLASALVVSWPELVGSFRANATGLGDGLGMVLLSVAYVPNALIGTASFLTGPGFSIGVTSVGLWSAHGHGVPGLALLAAVPETHSAWSLLLMVLPAAASVLVGRFCQRIGDRTSARMRGVLVAALLVAPICLVLAGLAGGALGGGRFDPVMVPAGLFAVSVFLWVAVVGSLATWLPRSWFVRYGRPRLAGEIPEQVTDEVVAQAGGSAEEGDDQPADQPGKEETADGDGCSEATIEEVASG